MVGASSPFPLPRVMSYPLARSDRARVSSNPVPRRFRSPLHNARPRPRVWTARARVVEH